MHPNFRGPFNNAEATASEKAVRDVLEALEYAKAHAPVDAERIYLAGFSGGAMMSLIMTGRYPEKFSAAVIWVPVYDLNDWYARLVPSPLRYTIQYGADIEASCGGNPLVDATARAECAKRSPSAYLADARGKGVRFYISGGLQDPFVPPRTPFGPSTIWLRRSTESLKRITVSLMKTKRSRKIFPRMCGTTRFSKRPDCQSFWRAPRMTPRSSCLTAAMTLRIMRAWNGWHGRRAQRKEIIVPSHDPRSYHPDRGASRLHSHLLYGFHPFLNAFVHCP
jgi:pimeloyl-ACP methyl ester carboxylesterase